MTFEDYFARFKDLDLIFSLSIKEKIAAMNLAVEELTHSNYPRNPLPFLPLSEDEVLDLITLNLKSPDLEEKISALDHLLMDFRNVVRENLGLYCILNDHLIDDLVSYLNSPVLEIAAGNGFLSSQLSKKGLDITAVDNGEYKTETLNESNFFPIKQVDAIDYLSKNLEKYSTIVLAWSPDNSDLDLKVLNLIRQNKRKISFIVIGEHNGKTNSTKFWSEVRFINLKKMLRLNKEFPDFDLYHDRIYMVE
ncbi:hypothetical protein [Xylocopilactobacillus apis]|uniref:SAM-dependent methyltransferase n=1 Tax=Xylocopilactobacillus apis TaxID=2932183 RepID=A0AAU9D1D8_9LACO|nr:hypothetical protein [Xylocopilactobacillus apis]BDR56291.1 hypothetical protein KIMC2_08530 [Xylocopilactobacillus apis]